jgi:hypothetical protein
MIAVLSIMKKSPPIVEVTARSKIKMRGNYGEGTTKSYHVCSENGMKENRSNRHTKIVNWKETEVP